MAVVTADVGMDDSELFQGAIANEPVKEATPEPAQEQEQGQPRDEHGRFAPRQEEAEAQPAEVPEPQAQEPAKEPDAHVPSWRLREVSEARQAAEARAQAAEQERYRIQAEVEAMRRQLSELQKPKQEPVDFFQNPDEALQQRLSPFEERFARMESQFKLNTSRAMAMAEFGKDAVNEMNAAIEKAIAERHPEMDLLAAQMRASDHPVAVAMQWHQRTKLQQETGGDLTKYREKTLEEALKDPAFLAKAIEAAKGVATTNSQNSRPNVQIPPSLNRTPGAGANDAAALTETDMQDGNLFRHAMSGPRRSR